MPLFGICYMDPSPIGPNDMCLTDLEKLLQKLIRYLLNGFLRWMPYSYICHLWATMLKKQNKKKLNIIFFLLDSGMEAHSLLCYSITYFLQYTDAYLPDWGQKNTLLASFSQLKSKSIFSAYARSFPGLHNKSEQKMVMWT